MSRTSPLCFSIYLCQFHLNFHHTYKKPSRQHVLYEEIHLACFSHNWPTRVVFLIETSLLIMWLGCRIRTLWNLLKWLNIWSKDLERRARFTLYITFFLVQYITFWIWYCRENHSLFITAVCACRLYISKRYHLERHHLRNFLVIFQELWEKHWLVLEYLDCTVTRYPIFCAYLVVEDHLFCVDFLLECSLKP